MCVCFVLQLGLHSSSIPSGVGRDHVGTGCCLGLDEGPEPAEHHHFQHGYAHASGHGSRLFPVSGDHHRGHPRENCHCLGQNMRSAPPCPTPYPVVRMEVIFARTSFDFSLKCKFNCLSFRAWVLGLTSGRTFLLVIHPFLYLVPYLRGQKISTPTL